VSDTDRDQYLAQVLQLDPEEDLHRAIALRRERAALLRGNTEAAPQTGQRPEAHQLRAILDEVSSELLDEDPEALRERVDALDLTPYPGLEQRARYMCAVLDARPDIDAASADPKSNESFLRFVRALLCANGEQAAELKRRAAKTLRTSSRAKEACKTLKHWKKNYPDLYALERVWFEEEALETTRALGGFSIGFGLFVAIYAAAKLQRFFVRD
jgi:chorismate mutase